MGLRQFKFEVQQLLIDYRVTYIILAIDRQRFNLQSLTLDLYLTHNKLLKIHIC
jgi:hypothetical protein